MFKTLAPLALAFALLGFSPMSAVATSAPLVNINTADASTLAREMEGIGESKAKAIVEYRQKNGPFRSIDELALVKGIGAKTLQANRSRLTVGTGAAARPTTGRANPSVPPARPVSGGSR